MYPLQGKSLAIFQEEMQHVRYILIDEMRFLGSRLFMQIDARLREAFPEKKNCPFGGRSIIFVGDLGQLPPMRDKPLHASNTTRKFLWNKFNIVVTLDTIFHQQGNNEKQSCFRRVLNNIRNVEPIIEYWVFLMSWDHMRLHPRERDLFNVAIRMFPTNNLVSFHNRNTLKSLNSLIS